MSRNLTNSTEKHIFRSSAHFRSKTTNSAAQNFEENCWSLLMSVWIVCMFSVDIPPTYDDAFEPPENELDSSGQWFRGLRNTGTDRHGSQPSNPAVSGLSHSADRSSSLQHSRPPRLRAHRHYSDVTDPHRRKRSVTYFHAFVGDGRWNHSVFGLSTCAWLRYRIPKVCEHNILQTA